MNGLRWRIRIPDNVTEETENRILQIAEMYIQLGQIKDGETEIEIYEDGEIQCRATVEFYEK